MVHEQSVCWFYPQNLTSKFNFGPQFSSRNHLNLWLLEVEDLTKTLDLPLSHDLLVRLLRRNGQLLQAVVLPEVAGLQVEEVERRVCRLILVVKMTIPIKGALARRNQTRLHEQPIGASGLCLTKC